MPRNCLPPQCRQQVCKALQIQCPETLPSKAAYQQGTNRCHSHMHQPRVPLEKNEAQPPHLVIAVGVGPYCITEQEAAETLVLIREALVEAAMAKALVALEAETPQTLHQEVEVEEGEEEEAAEEGAEDLPAGGLRIRHRLIKDLYPTMGQ